MMDKGDWCVCMYICVKKMNEKGYGCYLDGLEGREGYMDVFIVGGIGIRWFYMYI